jgi:hypothetical protein
MGTAIFMGVGMGWYGVIMHNQSLTAGDYYYYLLEVHHGSVNNLISSLKNDYISGELNTSIWFI